MGLQIKTELLERVKQGDEQAFEELYHLSYKHVYFLAYRVCRSDDDAKEVAQLTFLQIHKSIHNLKNNKMFASWLRRIVLSKCYNLFEHNRDSVYDPDESLLFRKEAEQRIYMQPRPQMRFQSDQEVMMHLIDSLPEKYRTVLVLMHFEGLSLDEMKDTLDIPLGTVKSRLSTARKFLKEKVEQYEADYDIHLDFHSLDPFVLTALYGAAFAASNVAIPTISGISSFSLLTKLKHIGKAGGAKVAVAGVVSVVGGVGAINLYQAYQNKQTTVPLVNHLNTSQLHYQEGEVSFEPVTIQDTTYKQAKDAYFALIQWAHCDIELQQKSVDEIKTYQILFDALKRSNGEYYDSLKKANWDVSYEKLLKK